MIPKHDRPLFSMRNEDEDIDDDTNPLVKLDKIRALENYNPEEELEE